MANWSFPDTTLSLSHKDVHVWRIAIDAQSASDIALLRHLLSREERQRMERYAPEKVRKQFVVGRGFLRILLGRYLRKAPEEIDFVYNPHGKPGLCATDRGHGIHFNISHSGGMVVCAFASGRPVGIDIELIRPFENALTIVERNFSDREKRAYRALPASLRNNAFFAGWTRKEAYVKAWGKGLSIPFDGFSVTMHPDEPVYVFHPQHPDRDANVWTVADALPIKGYACAVAMEGDGMDFKYFLGTLPA